MFELLIGAGKEIVTAGLAKGSGGNLSWRDGEMIHITGSGTQLDSLTAEMFVACPLHDPQFVPHRRPSSELPLHRAIYQALPTINTIFHAHPPQAIALGLLGKSLPALTPDFYLHLGAEIPLLPYETPTTASFAAAAAKHMAGQSGVLLQNHGVVVVGTTVKQAALRLALLEEHAGIYLQALASGLPIRTLSAADCAALDAATGGRYKIS